MGPFYVLFDSNQFSKGVALVTQDWAFTY